MKRNVALVVLSISGAACTNAPPSPSATAAETTPLLDPTSAAEQHGRDLWFKATFGGEKFFTEILPAAPFGLSIGFDDLITSDRNTRFDVYGVVNDPDCTQGDASTDYFDRCADPESAGVIGVRKIASPSPDGPRWRIGVACASCHAGLDPTHPPDNPNHPSWDSIHPTVGNQYLQTGKLFSAHLSPHDPRYQVFQSWAPGTVDTTAIESDHINNPGIITQFFQFPDRPFFDLTVAGDPMRVHRAGQGGEDDTGCERAALRVYFNIGMCAAECMLPHLANGPGGTQTPLDLAQCRRDCPDFVLAEQSVGDLCAFMQTPKAPRLEDAPGGSEFIDHSVVARGERIFARECASCHSNGQPLERNVLSDDAIHLASGIDLLSGEPPDAIGTHRCRALTTNWTAGHIWAPFSSDEYKARPTGGPGYYRDVPLQSVWATAPFFHNNRLGAYSSDPSVAGRVAAYDESMDELLNPWRRPFLASIQLATASVKLPGLDFSLPAGTPVNLFASSDPGNPLHSLCADLIENAGHYFGAHLSRREKYALKEFLKTR